MFNIKYTTTNKLIANISSAERAYGKLEALNIPKKLRLNLERRNLIESSYISNSMEGNPLSLPEVTNLLLDGRIPVNRDEKEIKNYFEILKSFDKKTPLDKKTLLKTHKELMQGVYDDIACKIRNRRVVIGKKIFSGGQEKIIVKHDPPYHKAKPIERELGNLLEWLRKDENISPIIKAGIFHHQFVFLHPFIDGNGRTCRLLTSLILLKRGFNINKYFILDDYYNVDRGLYSDKLHTADSGNKTEWLEYFSEGVMYSLQSALVKVEKQLDMLPIAERLSNREKDVLKILQNKKETTTGEVLKMLKVSRQQAHNLLSSLHNKGFIEKSGKTKGSFYKLK